MSKNNSSAYVGGQILRKIPVDVMENLKVQPDESIIPSTDDAIKFLLDCRYHKREE